MYNIDLSTKKPNFKKYTKKIQSKNDFLIKQSGIAESIQKQQKECSDYVTELTKDNIERLLKEDNYFFIETDWQILASGYKLPLLDFVEEEKQIYRFGGLTISGYKDSSIGTKKEALLLFKKILKHVEGENLQLIMKTWNPTLSRFLVKIWVEELSYEECLKKYPVFLKAYINKSEKKEEYYKKQKFYVRTKK